MLTVTEIARQKFTDILENHLATLIDVERLVEQVTLAADKSQLAEKVRYPFLAFEVQEAIHLSVQIGVLYPEVGEDVDREVEIPRIFPRKCLHNNRASRLSKRHPVVE